MTQDKRLTEQQRRFAELLVYNEGRMSPSECAYEAGYKTRPRQAASEMRNAKYFPLVVQYIGELRQEVQEKYGITFEKHITELAKIRDEARKVLLGESTELPSPSSESQPEEKHSDQKKPHPSHHTN